MSAHSSEHGLSREERLKKGHRKTALGMVIGAVVVAGVPGIAFGLPALHNYGLELKCDGQETMKLPNFRPGQTNVREARDDVAAKIAQNYQGAYDRGIANAHTRALAEEANPAYKLALDEGKGQYVMIGKYASYAVLPTHCHMDGPYTGVWTIPYHGGAHNSIQRDRRPLLTPGLDPNNESGIDQSRVKAPAELPSATTLHLRPPAA